MNWRILSDNDQIENIKGDDSETVHMIYKHSTRCSLSSMVLSRLERSWNEKEANNIELHFLDLIQFRDISDRVADFFEVRHESPQVILVKNGNPIYHSSHLSINYHEIVQESQ